MASPVRSVTSPFADLYDFFWSHRDPRTEGWAFIADAKFTFPLLIGYVYFAKVAGPRWMKDRKPFDLKWAILIYNALTVIANAYFAIRFLSLTYVGGNYSLFCQGINYSSPSERDMAILRLGWWYSFVRIGDFMDTVFFVLRKKNAQITFLHVIHHFLVVLSGWFFMNFGGDGQPIFGLCVNAFIHVIMYSYYFLAALGPAMQKYLWWKRYLTELQIVQFIGLMMHMAITLFYDCGYPKFLTMLALPQGCLGLGLFINFYIKSYRAQRKLHVSADKLKKHD
ncbi:very long chain fatty acid elongase AAEL008004-like [Dermacentor andersoni]|uniref:very long chain fatty acid elongase AAEL008004-like n=1 Tax=Dermacentor andersoni TaxID=34620 RepID=UPI0021559421|nr:elongation of very long chain fatty acids protein AAEL008004-like [Dermacentor andersoni]